MPAPARENNSAPTFFKFGMRLRFAWACIRSRHFFIAWSNRNGPGDNVGFVGLDMRLLHQADKAADFLAERLQFEMNINAMTGDAEAGE